MTGPRKRRSAPLLMLVGLAGLLSFGTPADGAHRGQEQTPAASPQGAARILEVSQPEVENLTFQAYTGGKNSFHLTYGSGLSASFQVMKVTENSHLMVTSVDAQAGAAWWPPSVSPADSLSSRITTVNFDVLVNGEVARSGSFAESGVPSQDEWDNWYGGDYPHPVESLSDAKLRMVFDINAIAEPFTEGSDNLSVRLSGSTYVWRNEPSKNIRAAPTIYKTFRDTVTSSVLLVSGKPYEVWKKPAKDSITVAHADSFTVELWVRNLARSNTDWDTHYGGNLMECRQPTIITAGPLVDVGPYLFYSDQNTQLVRSVTHVHTGTHPPTVVRILPDFDPIEADIAYPFWSVDKNKGKVYLRHVVLEPTTMFCEQDGDTTSTPGAVPAEPVEEAPQRAQSPTRTVVSPGGRIQPGPDPTVLEEFGGRVRLEIVSLLLGAPKKMLDPNPDDVDIWYGRECVRSGDQVEFRYEYRDIFGRTYSDVIPLTVPDSLDVVSPDTLAIRQPILTLTASESDLDPALAVDVHVLDLGAAPFGILKPVPGLSVAELLGGATGTTDADGRFGIDVPHGATVQLAVTDALERYLPLNMEASPPIEVNLTYHETAGGLRDNRLILWVTPGFANGRLQVGSGRIDNHAGELVPHVGAVSDIAPEEILYADWSTLDGQSLMPAEATQWGVEPREDMGYVPVLFALAPSSSGGAKNDPAFQALLQAVLAAGGAHLHVATSDGFLHDLDIPLEPGVVTGVGEIPSRSALALHVAPNPFNPTTTLSFTLAQASEVKLEVLSVNGRHVATLIEGGLSAGPQSVVWRGRDDFGAEAASGVYLARLRSGDVVATQKMILVR